MIAGIWFILVVFFLMLEGSTVSVVSIWFGAGAAAAMFAALAGTQLWLQIVLFVAVSCVLLALLRPVVRKYFTPKITKTGIDTLVGTAGIVQEDIDNTQAQGRVKLGALDWTARSTDGSPIPAGSQVVVDRLEGVKVFVSVK